MDLDKIGQIWTLLTALAWQGNAPDNTVELALKNAWDTAMSVLNNTKVPNLSEEFTTLEIASIWDFWDSDDLIQQQTDIENTEAEEEGIIEYIWEITKENKNILLLLLCGRILIYLMWRNNRREKERRELESKLPDVTKAIISSTTEYFELFKDEFENYKKNSEDSKRFNTKEIQFKHSENLNRLEEQIKNSLIEYINIYANLLMLDGTPINEADKNEIITLFKNITIASEDFLKESAEEKKSDDSIKICINYIEDLIRDKAYTKDECGYSIDRNSLLAKNIWGFMKSLFTENHRITTLLFGRDTSNLIGVDDLLEPNLREDLEKSLIEAFLEINNMARQIATSDSKEEEKIDDLIINTYKLQGILARVLEENRVGLIGLPISKKQELINKMEEILINIVTAWYIDNEKVLTNVNTEKQTEALKKKIADLKQYMAKNSAEGEELLKKVTTNQMWDINTYVLMLEALRNLETTIKDAESDF